MARTYLIVDDSETDRLRLQRLLEAEGHRTHMAKDGSEALECARRVHPDAILMDVNMPEMDGYAATRSLKSDAATKDIPIIIVSVRGQKADKAWAQMLGAKAHIGKPFTDAEMLEQLHAI